MIKPRGALCNLNCRYCYYIPKQKLYPQSNFTMSLELLEKFTLEYINSQNVPEITFTWQGGEPTLMGIDFFRKALELQKKYCKAGMRIHNALQTNATTLNDEWGRFFHEHHFLIGVSLDGPPEMHDVYRIDIGGKPTFQRVLIGLDILKKHRVEYNILTCVHAANVKHPLEVYRFLRDEIGARFIQFIPIVERPNASLNKAGIRVSEYSVTGQQYGLFLSAIFDEWVSHDVGSTFVQIFEVALEVWSGHPPSLCIFAEKCGSALVLEHNGDLYACDHFVEPRYRLGNLSKDSLMEMVSSPKQQRFGQDKKDKLPRYCRECEINFICNGECPKNRFVKTPDGKEGLNYLCQGYKLSLIHISEPTRPY